MLASTPTNKAWRIIIGRWKQTRDKYKGLTFRLAPSLEEMNHVQRLNEVKELKIFFFAQRVNTRKQASNRRPLPCDAMAPTVQNRAGARCPDRTRQRCVQQTSSYITALPWPPGLIVGPCPSEESLCCPAWHLLPLFADSRPLVSKVACLISLYLLSTCMYHTFSHITFLGYNHMHSRASVFLDSLLSQHISSDDTCVLGGGSFQVTTHGFSSRGVDAVRARRLFPLTISGVRGSVSVLPLGRKLDWQPVLSRVSRDSHLAV